MEEWEQPVYKKLAASELGEGSHTSGIVPTKNVMDYFGVSHERGSQKHFRIEFWYGDKSKTITTIGHYQLTSTHDHVHLTGNILPAYKNEGATVGDIVVFWKSNLDETRLKAELVKKNSARWYEAERTSSLSAVGGTLKLSPPGVDEEVVYEESDAEYQTVSDIEEDFSESSFPTVPRQGRKLQGERYVTHRSKPKGDFVLKKQQYKCQVDAAHASFITPNDVPYMEKHHLISMKFYEQYENDLDDINNIVALCSNCHRRIHLGRKSDISQMLEVLHAKLSDQLSRAGFAIDIVELKKKYGVS